MTNHKTKIACISGANGFIGKHLVELLERLDIFTVPIPHEYLDDSLKLEGIILRNRPDYIFHLAAYGNMHYQKDVDEMIAANTLGTYNLLKASNQLEYKSFIYVSTSSVALPVQTFYSASKLAAEAFCTAFVDTYNKPIIIARPYTVIGKGEQEQHLIPQLIKSCLVGDEIPFVSYPTHDFIDVTDMVQGLLYLSNVADDRKGEVFTIGSGKKYTNLAVKNIVEDKIGKQANIKVVDSLRAYDSNDWIADNGKLKGLGWKPRKDLEETIEDMVKYYEE